MIQALVGCFVTLACRMRRRSWLMTNKHAEGDRRSREEIHGRNRFSMVTKKGETALGWVRRNSPWMRGAPQPGFAATIGKINSRVSFEVGLLPACLRALEISRQYIQKPVRCQRKTVSGVTMIRDRFHAGQTRRAITQKSLSKRPNLGRGCRRYSVTSC